MAQFIDFQADVDTTDSEGGSEDEYVNDKHEVIFLIDDTFEADNDPLFYYQLQNVSKNYDETINNFLNEENESFNNEEIFNYCQESSEDKNKVDDFNYSKNQIQEFIKTLINPQSNTEDSLLYAAYYGVRFQKNKKNWPVFWFRITKWNWSIIISWINWKQRNF